MLSRVVSSVTDSLVSLALQSAMKLPPPRTRKLAVERDLKVEMPDGAILIADRWYPHGERGPLPTVLLRSPYGRGSVIQLMVRPFAERGFQVLVQSCRGTFGSSGDFEPFRNERRDGLATLEWIADQPWFDGSVILAGASYLGYVQWAVCDELPEFVKAVIMVVTTSNILESLHHPDAFCLSSARRWSYVIRHQEDSLLATVVGLLPRIDRWPIPVHPFFNEVAQHASNDDYWLDKNVNHRQRAKDLTVPASLIAGWHDMFLDGQLDDYRHLVAAGRSPRLIIGPWTHGPSMPSTHGASVREALGYASSATDRRSEPRRDAPVRFFVTGLNAWRGVATWPPEGYSPVDWHLQPNGALSRHAAPASPPDAYRLDFANPTPHVGGPSLSMTAGSRNQRARERRPDVLTYTSDPLTSRSEVVGHPAADIWVRSTRPEGLLTVTVCDVDRRGVSRNVTEGFARVASKDVPTVDGAVRVRVPIRATAHQFAQGHRIRIQVASAAHPLYETGADHEPPFTGGAEQEIFHDPDHQSLVTLPTN